MATHAANSLISDLAEMVQAVEALPQVQAQLDQVTEVNTKLATTIEDRDAHIKDLQSELASLLASLKQTEASRDDAELRFLELEDRVGKLTSAFALAHQNVAMANAVATEVQGWLKPPAPEPVVEAEGPQEFVPEPQGQSVANPTELTAVPSTDAVISAPSSVIPSENATSGTDTSYDTGVSVPADPTGALPDVSAIEQAYVSSAASEPTTASTQAEWPQPDEGYIPLPPPSYPAPIPTSTPEVAASANGSASPSADVGGAPKGPYTDKAFSEMARGPATLYPTWSEWITGGGTEENYYR